MSVTDTGYPHALRTELHEALTARGVDYRVEQGITFWNRDDGCECLAYGYETDEGVPNMAVKVVGFTDPERAVEATLGRGTCENKAPDYLDFLCSECGFVHYIDDANCTGDGNEWNFCPNCGAKVVR